MENETTLDALYEELADLEGIAWICYYDHLHLFNHKQAMKTRNRIEFLKQQIQTMENEK